MWDQHHSNPRLYARAPRGERAFGKVPRNWDKNVTLIAAMSAEGMGQAMSVEGATDGAAFESYVKHFLVPTLIRGTGGDPGQPPGPQEHKSSTQAH